MSIIFHIIQESLIFEMLHELPQYVCLLLLMIYFLRQIVLSFKRSVSCSRQTFHFLRSSINTKVRKSSHMLNSIVLKPLMYCVKLRIF